MRVGLAWRNEWSHSRIGVVVKRFCDGQFAV